VGAPVYGAAATYALGRVFLLHFDQGGTFLDFDPNESRHHFREEFEKAKNKDRSGSETNVSGGGGSASGSSASSKTNGKSSNTSSASGKTKGKSKSKSAGTAKVSSESHTGEDPKSASTRQTQDEGEGYYLESEENVEITKTSKAGRKATKGRPNDFTITHH